MIAIKPTPLPEVQPCQINGVVVNLDGKILSPLSIEEQKSLTSCEEIIFSHLRNFLDVGNALLKIRNDRLYRGTHTTFEAYCRERWELTKSHAYRLLNGAELVNVLSPVVDILPENERQLRPLCGLSQKAAEKVWKKALHLAGTSKITEKIVRRAAAQILPPTIKNKGKRSNQEMWQSQMQTFLKQTEELVRKKDRGGVIHLLQKMSLLVEVGNRSEVACAD